MKLHDDQLLLEQYMTVRWEWGRRLLVVISLLLIVGTVFWFTVSWALNRVVQRRTIELIEANKQLKLENEMRQRITESLKQSKALFKTLADGIFDGLAMVDGTGCFVYVNAKMEDMYGYAAGELLGLPFRRIISDGHITREMQKYLNWLHQSEEVPVRYESVLIRKDGTTVPVEISVQEVPVNGGRALVSIHRDISERKQMIRDMVGVVEWERRRIGQDLHDTIGQELTGIMYLAGALSREMVLPRSERAAAADEILGICREAHRQLRGIVAGLLPLGMNETLSEGLERLASNVRERLRVTCTVCDVNGPPVEDINTACHLYQIAQEAVANAVRHGGATEVRIGLESDGIQGRLVIDDNGCGFDPHTVKTNGSGLKIMRCRAELLGGSILFVKREDCGMSVRCLFGNRSDQIDMRGEGVGLDNVSHG